MLPLLARSVASITSASAARVSASTSSAAASLPPAAASRLRFPVVLAAAEPPRRDDSWSGRVLLPHLYRRFHRSRHVAACLALIDNAGTTHKHAPVTQPRCRRLGLTCQPHK